MPNAVNVTLTIQHRRLLREDAALKYKNRTHAKKIFTERKEMEASEMTVDPLEEMFNA